MDWLTEDVPEDPPRPRDRASAAERPVRRSAGAVQAARNPLQPSAAAVRPGVRPLLWLGGLTVAALAVAVVAGAVALRPKAAPVAPAKVGLVTPAGAQDLAAASASVAAAQAAAARAAADAAHAQQALASAQTAAAQVAALAGPVLARNPTSPSPLPALQNVRAADAQVAAAALAAAQDAAAASAAAQDAQQVAEKDTLAGQAAGQAQAAAAQARDALTRATAARTQSGAVRAQAESEAAAWQSVRTAPSGYLGATSTDPPAAWGVQGCELVSVRAGAPAAAAGMQGRDQRLVPVGDVVTLLADATDDGLAWKTPNCAALGAALAETRPGDHVTFTFERLQITWYLLSWKWVPTSGQATLTAGPSAGGAAQRAARVAAPA